MTCHLCNSDKSSLLFSLGKQPLANKYPKDLNEIKNEKLYGMNINFCKECLSCFLDIDINRDVFFTEYFYLSSVNNELIEHFSDLALELKDKNFVVDIGSNDGILLKCLKNLNVSFLGVEPSKNVGSIANSNGLETIISFFDEKITELILTKYKKPDCIVASSVFTHLENPNEFIINAKRLLSEDGVLIIEVEYLKEIIDNIQFERFYFDRPFYYTLTSLNKLFLRNDMRIVDLKKIKPHGGSLRIYVENIKINQTISKHVSDLLKYEDDKFDRKYILKRLSDFKKEVKKLKKELVNFKNNNCEIIGYGAPARLATITNFANIGKNLIKYIIDDNEIKVNRYSPGKHIPIKAYDKNKNLNNVILFAYEYYASINQKLNDKKIVFYKPIPFKKLN